MEGESNAPRPATVETIFTAALALPPAERPGYLAGASGGDAQLRQRVEALLRVHEAPEGFLPERPGALPAGVPILPTTATLPDAEKPGDRIGRYRLLEKIGEGGCGVVYMAEQEEPVRRKVALKIIKLGMDTRSVIARFEAERQALALMDHANIAKVHDAGATETGRPYFVMELVGGIKITDYCEQNNLTTRQRLDLFIQVCSAIQHAHQKGVIHRDIKPSNVLVATQDGVPIPKVIDFGIAKATQGKLADQTVFTAFEQFLGTPAYMSPEQAQVGGLDVDTRSDIYSLGVLLYELLTGKTPFDAKELLSVGLEAMRRTICEKEPPTPSTRLKQELAAGAASPDKPALRTPHSALDRDLDWIVMKCLEKDRARRYETANGLARDLERHLNSEPVVAGPPGGAYKLGKFVRRNKTAVAAVAAIATLLVLGVVESAWQARQQSRLRRQAQTEAAKSQQVARFLKEMLESVGPSKALGRDTTMLKEILDKTADRLSTELTNQPGVEIELRCILADTYRELGLYKEMEQMALKNLKLAQTVVGLEPTAVSEAFALLGTAQSELGNFKEAGANLRQALTLQRKLVNPDPWDVAAILNDQGLALERRGKLPQATSLYREALAICEGLPDHERPEVATGLSNLGNALGAQGRFAEAEEALRRALALQRKLLSNEDPAVARSLIGLAVIVGQEGKFAEAEALQREALAVQEKVLGREHHHVAISLHNLGALLREQSKLAEAETRLREAVAVGRKALGNEHADLAAFLNGLGLVLKEEGKLVEAATNHQEALAIQRKVLGNEHPRVAETLNNIANLLHSEGNFAEAENWYRESLAVLRKNFGDEHPQVALTLVNLAINLLDEDKAVEAETLCRQALAIQKKLLRPEHPSLAHTLGGLANSLSDQGRLAEAETVYHESLDIERKGLGQEHWKVAASLNNLALNLLDQGRIAEAQATALEALAMNRKALGVAHPNVIKTLNTLASVLQHQSKWSEVDALYRTNLPALRTRLQADDIQLAAALDRFAYTLLNEENFREAEPAARECVAIREKKVPDNWATFNARRLLGSSLLGQKRYAEAEPLLLSAYQGMKQREAKIPAGSKGRLKEALEALVQVCEAQGRSEQAAKWKQQLEEFERTQTNKPPAVPLPAKPSPKP